MAGEGRAGVWSLVDPGFPTEAGNWRSGREVVQSGDGLDPAHVLGSGTTRHVRKDGLRHTKVAAPQMAPLDSFPASPRRGEIEDVDLDALEAQSADPARSFLDTWKGRVPLT